ncbi:MAG: type I-F CRISPR-associated protein Csy2 [Rhodanobacter sp.]|nr:MAG: type I-F CRISPR-associated protein Csy2 [Rhodanobacter sp.]TAM03072.1 MAG: type I-F CRISPR-associated protein Csy2 [Rhodanobacter sp.]TAM38636.1 MAG: type I-F CRISPR-associated protein Csy2 [Rhodanobacter sp.]TAN23661.1 MAG: type I-F CRISPR-associated protein Csy2 [Rhodanobacter sp.]
MNACPNFTHLLVLPHLKVHNANAISSPLTHGFPSITAFLGLMWALERKTRAAGLDLEFGAVGVVCHSHQEQTTESGFVKAFRLTRNAVGKDGKTAAIVEEGRIHLDLSLVLAVHAGPWDQDAQRRDLKTIADLLQGMRIAGGTLLPAPQTQTSRHRPWLADLTGNSDDQANAFRKLRARLLPGSALVARDDLIDQRLRVLQAGTPEPTRLDAWLSLCRINWYYDMQAEGGTGAWQNDRTKGSGWVVPIPVGYGALGDLHEAGSVPNARDASTPFRFVESLYSMGEWIGPHRLHSPQDLLWYADSHPDDGLYRCRNDYHTVNTNL